MSSPVLAIDPGPEQSAYVEWDGESLLAYGKWPNADLLHSIRRDDSTIRTLVIEKIASYGMAVGSEVFETCYWSGRFAEAHLSRSRRNEVHRIERLKVKLQLCRDSRAKDANIRQALIDRFGAPGTKKNPGMLYGVSGDVWAAMAVAVTYWDTKHIREALGA
jgi:hypothetical protein